MASVVGCGVSASDDGDGSDDSGSDLITGDVDSGGGCCGVDDSDDDRVVATLLPSRRGRLTDGRTGVINGEGSDHSSPIELGEEALGCRGMRMAAVGVGRA